MSSVVDEPVSIIWEITTTNENPVGVAYWDIVLITPDGLSTYVVAPMTSYVDPTLETKGSMTYTFTPGLPGSWTVRLVHGDADAYNVLDELFTQALCSIPTIVPDPRAIASTRFNALGECPSDDLILAQSVTFWRDIHALGKHATDNKKIVFAGIPAFGDPPSIGILDRRDGTIVTMLDAFSTAIPSAGGSLVGIGGIDCNPNTGVYVASSLSQVSNNEYPSFWSTDLVTWTECLTTGFDTRFHGKPDIRYDSNHELFYWMDDVATYTSDDGMEFHRQGQDFDDIDGRMAQIHGFLHSGHFDQNLDQAFFGGNTGRPMSSVNPDQSLAPINFLRVSSGENPSSPGIIDPGNPPWFGGCAAGPGVIVMATVGGEMIYSITGTINSWQIAAVDPGNTPPGPTNEWIDPGITNIGEGLFTFFNGLWWAPAGSGGAGDWYFYDGLIPIGDGWVQSDTGPFKVQHIQTSWMRDPFSAKFAYGGYDTVAEDSFHERIFYDISDI